MMLLEEDGEVWTSIALCNDKDQFNKKIARRILRGRLEKKNKILQRGEDFPLVFQAGKYTGTNFKQDVFNPILKKLDNSMFGHIMKESLIEALSIPEKN